MEVQASIPPRFGIRTSMSTMSGSRSAALSTASEPSPASPTTWMSSSCARTISRPRRKSAWSSTTRTRMGSLAGRFLVPVVGAARAPVRTPGAPEPPGWCTGPKLSAMVPPPAGRGPEVHGQDQRLPVTAPLARVAMISCPDGEAVIRRWHGVPWGLHEALPGALDRCRISQIRSRSATTGRVGSRPTNRNDVPLTHSPVLFGSLPFPVTRPPSARILTGRVRQIRFTRSIRPFTRSPEPFPAHGWASTSVFRRPPRSVLRSRPPRSVSLRALRPIRGSPPPAGRAQVDHARSRRRGAGTRRSALLRCPRRRTD